MACGDTDDTWSPLDSSQAKTANIASAQNNLSTTAQGNNMAQADQPGDNNVLVEYLDFDDLVMDSGIDSHASPITLDDPQFDAHQLPSNLDSYRHRHNSAPPPMGPLYAQKSRNRHESTSSHIEYSSSSDWGSLSPGSREASGILRGRRRRDPIPAAKKDDRYWRRRLKNNDAAKRSREAKRDKEIQMSVQVSILEKQHMYLKNEIKQANLEGHALRSKLTTYDKTLSSYPRNPTTCSKTI